MHLCSFEDRIMAASAIFHSGEPSSETFDYKDFFYINFIIHLCRYKDDIYDRIWTPRTLADTKKLNTSLAIDQGFQNGYQPGSTVMNTAETPQNESRYMTLIFRPFDSNAKFYVYLHFAEIEELKSNVTREFHIWLDETILTRSFKPRYLFTDTVSTPYPVGGITVNFSLQQPPGDSVLPPIINALEIYQVNDFLQIPTDPQDGN